MNPVVFKLTTDYIELSKLLKACGLCESGGAAKHAVIEKQVCVDGSVEVRKGRKVRRGQQIEYAGQIIKIE
jgi:ribosome-associated protein